MTSEIATITNTLINCPVKYPRIALFSARPSIIFCFTWYVLLWYFLPVISLYCGDNSISLVLGCFCRSSFYIAVHPYLALWGI